MATTACAEGAAAALPPAGGRPSLHPGAPAAGASAAPPPGTPGTGREWNSNYGMWERRRRTSSPCAAAPHINAATRVALPAPHHQGSASFWSGPATASPAGTHREARAAEVAAPVAERPLWHALQLPQLAAAAGGIAGQTCGTGGIAAVLDGLQDQRGGGGVG